MFDESIHCQEQTVLEGLKEKESNLARLLTIVNSGDLNGLEELIQSSSVISTYRTSSKWVWGADKPVIGRFFSFCLEKGEKGGKKLQAKAGRGLFVALLLFVGIPLPGTGAWTGTLAASLLDMDFKSSVVAVMCGVLLAGIIMGAASAGLFGALGALIG